MMVVQVKEPIEKVSGSLQMDIGRGVGGICWDTSSKSILPLWTKGLGVEPADELGEELGQGLGVENYWIGVDQLSWYITGVWGGGGGGVGWGGVSLICWSMLNC